MNERFSFVDSLRGLAALGVVLVHCTVITHQAGWLFWAGSAGQRGVQLIERRKLTVKEEEVMPALS